MQPIGPGYGESSGAMLGVRRRSRQVLVAHVPGSCNGPRNCFHQVLARTGLAYQRARLTSVADTLYHWTHAVGAMFLPSLSAMQNSAPLANGTVPSSKMCTLHGALGTLRTFIADLKEHRCSSWGCTIETVGPISRRSRGHGRLLGHSAI